MPGTTTEENTTTGSAPVGGGILHLVGLGLGDERDITLRGLDAVKSCGTVYLEAYTSILGVKKASLEALYGCEITVADREFVEEKADQMLNEAQSVGCALLVVGDPFGATTHTDLWLRARERNIHVNVVHNASIINAVGVAGLQLYQYGAAVSLCFWTKFDRPTSYFPKIISNLNNGLHTLCLLDIKVREPSLEMLARGKKVYEPPRYMSVNQAVDQLLTIADETEGTPNSINSNIGPDSLAIGVARIGQKDQCIKCGPMKLLKDADFGAPLHSLIIPAKKLHFHEIQVLREFCVEGGEYSLPNAGDSN